MSSNFWESTQGRNWLYTRDSLAQHRQILDGDGSLAQQFPLPEYRLLSIFFYQQLLRLVKRLNLRQAPLATAQVYLRRFYVKVPVRQTNPYLMLTTALYVACKIEELPQNIRIIVAEARNLWPEYIGPDVASVGESEFRLISCMECELILHHPYRSVRYLESSFQLAQDESSLAWGIVNDSFLTDLPLLYPPHVIAWSAVFITLALKLGGGGHASGSAGIPTGGAGGGGGHMNSIGHMSSLNHIDMADRVVTALQEAKTQVSSGGASATGHQTRLYRFLEAFAESEVNMTAVSEAVQEIISLYLLWESAFREKEIKEQVARFVKSRGLDR